MIKQKAPKDMTVSDFIDLVERRYAVGTGCNMDHWINTLRMIAEEPAPNPFTPDQLAWMRIKQGEGYQYAAMDFDNEVRLFGEKPDNDGTHWNGQSGYVEQSIGLWSWMRDYLSPDDPEPLCFADYAPLEEKTE